MILSKRLRIDVVCVHGVVCPLLTASKCTFVHTVNRLFTWCTYGHTFIQDVLKDTVTILAIMWS